MADPAEGLTLKQIVLGLDSKVDDLILGQARVEGKLDPALVVVTDHETRIRSLEQSGFRLAGAWSAFAVIGGGLAGVLGLALGAAALILN